MGIDDVILGIFGGMIAFMLEIYEDLIKDILSFDMEFVKYLLKGKFKQASNNLLQLS